MKLLSTLLFAALFTLPASGTLLIQQEDTWDYCVLDFDLKPAWDSIGYDSFDWDNADWIEGQAAFGNSSPRSATINTRWNANTDLALRNSFELESIPMEDIILSVAVDNGFIMFINGQEVEKHIRESFTSVSPWEYIFLLSAEDLNLQLGTNIVSVFAEDHGANTFFDMKLEVVPEPATICIFSLGAIFILKNRRQ